MTITEDQRNGVIIEAESWLGTPWYDFGADRNAAPGKGTRVDCSHLVHEVYRACGLTYEYRSTGTFASLREFEATTDPKHGDVILFRGHMGLFVRGDASKQLLSAHGRSGRSGVVKRGPLSDFGAVEGFYRWR